MTALIEDVAPEGLLAPLTVIESAPVGTVPVTVQAATLQLIEDGTAGVPGNAYAGVVAGNEA